jgi:cell division protein FtsN
VLSLGACFALVWAANQLPGPDEGEKHGRDAVMFAERLSSEPNQIMRLASTAEAADADEHVKVWTAQPPRPVAAAEPVAVAKGEPQASPEAPATASAKPAPHHEEAFVGPMPNRPVEVAYAPAKELVPAKKTVAAPAEQAKVPAKPATKQVASAKKKSDPVYTVQLGAFKARRNADEMVAKLRGKSPRILEEGGFYRVLSGSFSSKREASLHEASLRRAGYTTYVRTAVF